MTTTDVQVRKLMEEHQKHGQVGTAALRAGIKTVLLPARNKKDLEEIPESARQQLNFVWLEHVDEAIDAAIEAEALMSSSAA